MPVRKFRSVEEMNQPTWHRPGDPALSHAMSVIWDFARRANPRRFAPGVVRFASAEQMRRHQEQEEAEYVAALRKRPPQ